MCISSLPALRSCAAGGACRASCTGRAIARFEGRTAEQALAAARADPACLMVNRNAGAGTRVLIDRLLAGARPPGYANQPRSHNAVAAAIAQNRADWGVAIEPVARLYGLAFLPVAPEALRFPAGGEPAASGRRCRLFWRPCATRRCARAFGALGMQPADMTEGTG